MGTSTSSLAHVKSKTMRTVKTLIIDDTVKPPPEVKLQQELDEFGDANKLLLYLIDRLKTVSSELRNLNMKIQNSDFMYQTITQFMKQDYDELYRFALKRNSASYPYLVTDMRGGFNQGSDIRDIFRFITSYKELGSFYPDLEDLKMLAKKSYSNNNPYYYPKLPFDVPRFIKDVKWYCYVKGNNQLIKDLLNMMKEWINDLCVYCESPEETITSKELLTVLDNILNEPLNAVEFPTINEVMDKLYDSPEYKEYWGNTKFYFYLDKQENAHLINVKSKSKVGGMSSISKVRTNSAYINKTMNIRVDVVMPLFDSIEETKNSRLEDNKQIEIDLDMFDATTQ